MIKLKIYISLFICIIKDLKKSLYTHFFLIPTYGNQRNMTVVKLIWSLIMLYFNEGINTMIKHRIKKNIE